jgi:adenylate cyclase
MLLTGVVMAGLQRRSALETLARVWPTWVSEEGEQLEVTVLVCDMAGYTARSERLEPTDLMSMMREFFAIVDDVVGDWGGVSARRPGDAAVVFFRPDREADHHAARALRAAHDLRDRLDERWPADDIGFGITLTTGEVSLGWVGEAPPEPQILGDPVNVAFRLQSECREKSCPILADWDTATADDEMMARMRPLGEVEVRNRTEPVQIFTPAQDL